MQRPSSDSSSSRCVDFLTFELTPQMVCSVLERMGPQFRMPDLMLEINRFLRAGLTARESSSSLTSSNRARDSARAREPEDPPALGLDFLQKLDSQLNLLDGQIKSLSQQNDCLRQQLSYQSIELRQARRLLRMRSHY